MNNKEKGNIAEKIAKDYLVKKGYSILETNYQTKDGEIDILAFYKEKLIAFEVKMRTKGGRYSLEDAINLKKIKKINLTLDKFIDTHSEIIFSETQIDAIWLSKDGETYSIRHIQNFY